MSLLSDPVLCSHHCSPSMLPKFTTSMHLRGYHCNTQLPTMFLPAPEQAWHTD